MGSCFRFGFKKKQSYAFHNAEPYVPAREDTGRYRASVTVQSWMDTNEEDRYTPSKQNGLQNGHHSPEPETLSTPTKGKPYDAIYDTADPPNHRTHVDEDRKSVSSSGSHEVKANGYIAEDRASVHSEKAPEPEVKEVKKKKEIPPHDMENPPPFDHKLNDYQKTMLEIEEAQDEFHVHHTVVLGGYSSSGAAAAHEDDDDDVSSVSSHGSVKLEQAEEEEAAPSNVERSEYAETHHYEYDDDQKDHELVMAY